jgi:hypothetical protein
MKIKHYRCSSREVLSSKPKSTQIQILSSVINFFYYDTHMILRAKIVKTLLTTVIGLPIGEWVVS